MSQHPSATTTSPLLRTTERPFRSATTSLVESMSSSQTSNTARKKLLLSDNQLSNIEEKLANIRHGGSSTPLFQPTTTSDHFTTNATHEFYSFSERIGDLSVQLQEYAIMEDLLYVLMGIDGTYIQCVYPAQEQASEEDVSTRWPTSYHIDPSLDPSLRHLIEKILPLATYYVSVEAFIETYSRFEYGTVNHALCSAIRVFTKEYLTFLAQLEHQFLQQAQFTLQKLWFFAQATIQNMKILHELATTIREIQLNEKKDQDNIDAVIEGLQKVEHSDEVVIAEERKGGAILNILSEKLTGLGGDPNCKKVYSFLLSKASVPYFEILNAWIYHGEIKDPYSEFMVLEKRNLRKENLKEDYNDTYWEMRYTLRDSVPVFLKPMETQILLAGKYLNVVRECGVAILANPEQMQQQQEEVTEDVNTRPTRSEVWAAVDGARFVKNLQVAYKYANQTLLNLLMQDQQLIARLRSMKHYFFLDQSDFLTSFLDLAQEELKESSSKIPQNRLQSLMDLVLRNPSSVAAYDPFKEDVKVTMSHLRLVDQLLRIINVHHAENQATDAESMSSSITLSNSMNFNNNSNSSHVDLTGYEAFVLDYTVTFPLSLIISRKALTKYQLLFRHVLNLKHVEDQLCQAWMDQKNLLWKRRSHQNIEHLKLRIYALRNRMLTFVQQFAYYVTNEVLEPNYRKLEAHLTTNITTVDQVLQFHSDFLDTCLKECMLTNSKLLRIFHKLISGCQAFTSQAEKFTSTIKILEEEQSVDRLGLPKLGLNSTNLYESTNRLLSKMEETFLYHMKLLIEALNYYSAAETIQFLCLVVRLDYNQFYNSVVNRR